MSTWLKLGAWALISAGFVICVLTRAARIATEEWPDEPDAPDELERAA